MALETGYQGEKVLILQAALIEKQCLQQLARPGQYRTVPYDSVIEIQFW